MKILHTADWHLGDRLGRIDRTQDLHRTVERVGQWCKKEEVDVLLVAGDLFSEMARPDSLRESIHHWQEVFREFLEGGGTILTLTGNHDNENFCQTLHHAMSLAAPSPGGLGSLISPGRLYLAAEPSLLRLKDRREGFEVQFLLMPYPTPSRYFRDEAVRRYSSPEEKNQQLETAFRDTMQKLQLHDKFDKQLPTILGAHIGVRNAAVGSGLFRITEADDVLLTDADLPEEFAYVALGHIHKPQYLGGKKHIRYSGSIEKMDLGEKDDSKSVVVFEVDSTGLRGEPRLLPLPSSPVYEVDVRNPTEEFASLREKYPDARDDLVSIHLTYTAGVDNLEEVLRGLEEIFPRWYSRDWREVGELGDSLSVTAPNAGRGFQETVRDFLTQELMNHPEADRDAILQLLDDLLKDDPAK